jgi:hypothetical protein
MIKKYLYALFLYGVTIWNLYTLSNEIKIFLIIINYKWHLVMCIVTPKQYIYNVRYKYLGPEWR